MKFYFAFLALANFLFPTTLWATPDAKPDPVVVAEPAAEEAPHREFEVWVNPGHAPIYSVGLHDLLIFRAGANYYFDPGLAISLGLMYGTNNLYSNATDNYFRDFSASAYRYEFDLGLIVYLAGNIESHGFFLRPSVGYSKIDLKYKDDDDQKMKASKESLFYSLGTGYSYVIAKRLTIAHGITLQAFGGPRSIRLKNFQDDGDDDRVYVDWVFDHIRVDLRIGLVF